MHEGSISNEIDFKLENKEFSDMEYVPFSPLSDVVWNLPPKCYEEV